MNLYLTGIMGCGKSSAGQKAAQILGVPFLDSDSEVELQAGSTAGDLFRLHGEEHFRSLETAALKRISEQSRAVVSTGGGVILRPENVEIMRKTGRIIWIERPVDAILKCADASVRPLIAKNPRILIDIYAAREPLYRKYAHAIVPNMGTLDEAADAIVLQYRLLIEKEQI